MYTPFLPVCPCGGTDWQQEGSVAITWSVLSFERRANDQLVAETDDSEAGELCWDACDIDAGYCCGSCYTRYTDAEVLALPTKEVAS